MQQINDTEVGLTTKLQRNIEQVLSKGFPKSLQSLKIELAINAFFK